MNWNLMHFPNRSKNRGKKEGKYQSNAIKVILLHDTKILRFDISVNDLLLMQHRKDLKQLVEHLLIHRFITLNRRPECLCITKRQQQIQRARWFRGCLYTNNDTNSRPRTCKSATEYKESAPVEMFYFIEQKGGTYRMLILIPSCSTKHSS